MRRVSEKVVDGELRVPVEKTKLLLSRGGQMFSVNLLGSVTTSPLHHRNRNAATGYHKQEHDSVSKNVFTERGEGLCYGLPHLASEACCLQKLVNRVYVLFSGVWMGGVR